MTKRSTLECAIFALMDRGGTKGVIDVIRAEKQRRSARLAEEDPNIAYDQWLFAEEPFLNDLRLILLVAVRHQLERQLVRLAARVTPDGSRMDFKQYQQNVEDERQRIRRRNGWKELIRNLNPSEPPTRVADPHQASA